VRKLIFHIPHASTFIPADARQDLLLDDAALANEVRVLTDHFTDKIFGDLALPEDTVVQCPVSRLVVDVERFIDDAQEPMSARGMGVVYAQTHELKPLRASLEMREDLLKRFYEAHHANLAAAVEKHLALQGEAIILDCHSFPQHALPYEADQRLYRPEICIGTDPYHTSVEMAEAVAQAYRNNGFKVAFNTPFAGALVPLASYSRDLRVKSIMIEVRRDVYMDEETSRMKVDWSKLAQANVAATDALRQVLA
jgi:N-formylglutamate deformylase